MKEFNFDHVHIYSNNVENTVSFYIEVFGATKLRTLNGKSGKLVYLNLGNARIVVSNADKENVPGIRHFAISSTSNLDQSIAYLKNHGCEVSNKNHIGNLSNVFLKDPTGVSIEIIEPSTD